MSNMLNGTYNITRTDMPEWLYKLFGVYLSLAFVVGILGNGFSLFLFCKYGYLRSPTNMYIGGLICTDLVMCILGIPLSATSTYVGRWLWGYEMCVFQGFIVYFCGLSNMCILAAISYNRYVLITKLTNVRDLRYKTSFISLCVCVSFGLFWSTAPFTGWTRYEFEGIGTTCAIAYDSTEFRILSYNITIFIFCFLSPISIMIWSFYNILNKVNDLRRDSLLCQQNRLMKNNINLQKRLTKTFLLMTCAFLISWTPYAVVSFWKAFGLGELPVIATAFPAIIAKTSSVSNPFIYVFHNTQFKKALLEMFPCLRKKSSGNVQSDKAENEHN